MIESIIKGFEIWTDAQGIKSRGRVKSIDNISLDGIARLRELIIDVAIRGKLVPQDENDEPASILLDKSLEEKNRRIEEGEIKKHKKLDDITEDMKPFELPNGWEWTWFADAYFFQEGPGIRNWQFRTQGIKLLNVQNIVNNKLILDNTDKYIDEEEYKEKYLHFTIQENDLLYASSGGSWGKSAFFTNPGYKVIVNTSTIRIHPYVSESSRTYLKSFLDSNFFKNQMIEQLVGMQPNFGSTHFLKILVPIPPANEQVRIAEKIVELNSLCDKLEEEQTSNLSTHHQLVKSLLETLIQAKDADELQSSWERISEHFDTLFCTEDSIEQLKETILQLALRGKLTKQDPNDENATELKQKIVEDFEKLAKEGKAKKPNTFTPIKEDEIPFVLPDRWEWVRLQEIIQISSGDGLTASNMNSNGEIPVYGGNGVNGYHDKFNVTKPTLVIGRVGFYCGSIHITPSNAWVTDNAFITTFSEDNIHLDFLFWLLKGTNLKENDSATAQPVISGRKVYPIVVALPPFNEQRRIVEMIFKCYTICDSLKTKIEKAQDVKDLLSKTIVTVAV